MRAVSPGSARYFKNEQSLVGIARASQKQVDKLCAEIESMDIESRGLIGENIAGAATDGDAVLLFHIIDELLLYALSRPRMIAHNGAGFDFPRLIQRFFALNLQEQYTINSFFSGERMIALCFTRIGDSKPCSVWLDTYAQIPSSLAAFTKAFAPDVAKLSGSIDFEAGEIWSWDNPQHVEYLRRDVVSLKTAYINFVREMYRNFGILVGMSAAGNALKAFRVNMLEQEKMTGHFITYFRLAQVPDEIARRACFGGWVFPGVASRLYRDTVKRDFKGAYGAIMRDSLFPIGTPCYSTRFHDDKLGIYTVTVTAPDSEWCASLPFRNDEQELRYLSGGSSCTTSMISQAIIYYRSIGYHIEIVEGIYWEAAEYVFQDLMLKCERMEAEGGARKDIAKLVRNGLSGRFKLGHEAKRLLVTDEPPAEAMPCIKGGSIVPHVYEVIETVDDACMLPHFYAFITGLHRLKMVQLAQALGPEGFLYCDTDSVECPASMNDSPLFYQGAKKDARYGDCVLEARHTHFLALGPKHYYTREKQLEARLKGIPRRKISWLYIGRRLKGWKGKRTFSYESPTNARMMLKAGGSAPLGSVRTREVAWNRSQTWVIDDLGNFVAMQKGA